MDIYFDSCTEYLYKYLSESSESEEEREWAAQSYDSLSELKKGCISASLCPKGEFERGYICREYLRKATSEVIKQINRENLWMDETAKGVYDRTKAFIEEIGDDSEADRACVVIRNLLVILTNMIDQSNAIKEAEKEKERQQKGNRLNLIKQQAVKRMSAKPEMKLKEFAISQGAVKLFLSLVNAEDEKGHQRAALKAVNKINLPTMKSFSVDQYRRLFYRGVIQKIGLEEKIK
jgi:hypothetical protein